MSETTAYACALETMSSAVITFHLVIFVTILAPRILLRGTADGDARAASRMSLGVAGLWTLFTFANVYAGWLLALQLGTIWSSYLLGRQLAANRAEKANRDPGSGRRPHRTNRTIHGPEHLEIFRRALREARETLVIVSWRATAEVVEQGLLAALAELLRRGVDVRIGIGNFDRRSRISFSPGERVARRRLARFLRDVAPGLPGRLSIAALDSHEKVLICDDRWAVCGSFNWLANAHPSLKERSWLVEDPEFVRRERRELVRRIEEAGRGTGRRASA